MTDYQSLAALAGLERLLQTGMTQMSSQVAGIDLSPAPHTWQTDPWCTVYTHADGALPLTLALYAPQSVIHRAALNMLGEDELYPQDLEECALEYLNVFAGWVVSQIYQQLPSSVMLHPPSFCRGRYSPGQAQGPGGTLHFATDRNEGVDLIWNSPSQASPPENH